jgi:hypothetical protein
MYQEGGEVHLEHDIASLQVAFQGRMHRDAGIFQRASVAVLDNPGGWTDVK